jgi:hypothetical protein
MSELKTKPTPGDARDFIDTVDNPVRAKDGLALLDLMEEVSGKPAVMWGSSLIGFDSYHYKSASGQEGDWPRIAFSPRKASISLYVTYDAALYEEELRRLGKHKVGKGCIYINKLADVDMDQLRALIVKAYNDNKRLFPDHTK